MQRRRDLGKLICICHPMALCKLYNIVEAHCYVEYRQIDCEQWHSRVSPKLRDCRMFGPIDLCQVHLLYAADEGLCCQNIL